MSYLNPLRLHFFGQFQAAVSTATGNPATAPPAAGQDTSSLAERITHLREQAEQMAKELETLEKETQKKK